MEKIEVQRLKVVPDNRRLTELSTADILSELLSLREQGYRGLALYRGERIDLG